MQPAPRRWRLSDAEPLPGLHPVVGHVLAARGFDLAAASAFLDTGCGYHDPFGLPAMEDAVAAGGSYGPAHPGEGGPSLQVAVIRLPRISNFTDVGDVSTLANPEIVDSIRHHVQSEKLAHGEVPRELSPEEAQEIKAYGQDE